jgi:hypothetical protein
MPLGEVSEEVAGFMIVLVGIVTLQHQHHENVSQGGQ